MARVPTCTLRSVINADKTTSYLTRWPRALPLISLYLWRGLFANNCCLCRAEIVISSDETFDVAGGQCLSPGPRRTAHERPANRPSSPRAGPLPPVPHQQQRHITSERNASCLSSKIYSVTTVFYDGSV